MDDLTACTHELNNLLSVVLSYTGFAIEDVQDPAVLQDLGEVRRAASRASELVSQLQRSGGAT